jgi:hypothetical protein
LSEAKPKKEAAPKPKKDNTAFLAAKAEDEKVNSSCTIATDFAHQQCAFKQDDVSDAYKEEWPSHVDHWIPLHEWKSRRSPQSNKACKVMIQLNLLNATQSATIQLL